MTEQTHGYLYILRNRSLPSDYVKIGYTKDIQERLQSLHNTSLPTPFEIVRTARVPLCDMQRREKDLHRMFQSQRISDGREFFHLSDEQLAAAISYLNQIQDTAFLAEEKRQLDARLAQRKEAEEQRETENEIRRAARERERMAREESNRLNSERRNRKLFERYKEVFLSHRGKTNFGSPFSSPTVEQERIQFENEQRARWAEEDRLAAEKCAAEKVAEHARTERLLVIIAQIEDQKAIDDKTLRHRLGLGLIGFALDPRRNLSDTDKQLIAEDDARKTSALLAELYKKFPLPPNDRRKRRYRI